MVRLLSKKGKVHTCHERERERRKKTGEKGAKRVLLRAVWHCQKVTSVFFPPDQLLWVCAAAKQTSGNQVKINSRFMTARKTCVL